MRLIDTDELKKQLKKLPIMSNWGEAFIPQIIDEQPIIDPVHVAGGCYCRECRFWEEQDWGGADKLGDPIQQGGKCKLLIFGSLANDFCSRGKRKEASHDKYPSDPL